MEQRPSYNEIRRLKLVYVCARVYAIHPYTGLIIATHTPATITFQ